MGMCKFGRVSDRTASVYTGTSAIRRARLGNLGDVIFFQVGGKDPDLSGSGSSRS